MSKRTMQRWLLAAGVYNLVWGAWTVLFPNALFDILSAPRPNYPELWQCIGMIVGVYGVGYLCATLDPLRHWPIVLVGLLGKIFGPIGFVWGITTSSFPPAFGLTILTNDLLWWVPFFLILRAAYLQDVRSTDLGTPQIAPSEALTQMMCAVSGKSVAALSAEQTIILVFLRHNGCTFCRETIGDIARLASRFEQKKILPVFIISGSPEGFLELTQRYKLAKFDYVADPELTWYRVFNLSRGSIGALFGPAELSRALSGAFLKHGIGFLDGDGLQLPGAFLIRGGTVVFEFRHTSASDRPNYCEIIDR